MTKHSSQSLAVIDATDAVVLPPESQSTALTVQQSDQLERCGFHLIRLTQKIVARERDLIYSYVEAGFYLLKAQDAHRVPTVGTRSDGKFVSQEDSGFLRWLDTQQNPIPRNTAYRWMQGARNCGLSADSNITSLQAIKEEKRLHGHTLTDICRKPVDKQERQADLTDVTEEEEEIERLKDLKEAYRLSGQFLSEQVIQEQSWADISPEEINAYAQLLADAARAVKAGLKKAKALPAPKAPIVPTADKASDTPEPGGDRVCKQADIERGLWWWGWVGFRGTVMAKTYAGDMAIVIAARSDPRIGKTVVGPFYAETLGDAEKIIEQQDIDAKI